LPPGRAPPLPPPADLHLASAGAAGSPEAGEGDPGHRPRTDTRSGAEEPRPVTTPASATWLRAAASADAAGIEDLLRARNLPTAGAPAHLATFVVATRGNSLLSRAGIRRYGDVVLLRSDALPANVSARAVVTGL